MENFSPKEIPETFLLQWIKKKKNHNQQSLTKCNWCCCFCWSNWRWLTVCSYCVAQQTHPIIFSLWNEIKYNNDLSVFLEETWSTVLLYFVHLQPMWVAMAFPHLSIQDQSWPKFLITVYPAKTKMAWISTYCPYVDKTNRTGTGFFVYS